MPMKESGTNVCYRCGVNNHWAKICRTAPHLVELYQASLKNKGKKVQAHATESNEQFPNVEANTSEITREQIPIIDGRSLEISDLFEDPVPKIKDDDEWAMY